MSTTQKSQGMKYYVVQKFHSFIYKNIEEDYHSEQPYNEYYGCFDSYIDAFKKYEERQLPDDDCDAGVFDSEGHRILRYKDEQGKMRYYYREEVFIDN